MSNVAAKIHRGVFGTYCCFDASCIPHKIQEPKRSFICGDSYYLRAALGQEMSDYSWVWSAIGAPLESIGVDTDSTA
jgi:hypothetical protein